MKTHGFFSFFLAITSFTTLPNSALAIQYYENDFEDEQGGMPVVGAPDPVWLLPDIFKQNYGPGNFFEVTSSTAHTGNYSLRFTYEGRNGSCNICGSVTRKHKNGLDGVDYFVADTGEDLTILDNPNTTKAFDSPGAAPDRIIYNKSAGYSKWKIVSVTDESAKNDRLNLKLLKAGINGESSVFNGGDDIAITKECGVNGNIGITGGKPDLNRRVDCNNVIIWFGGLGTTNHAPGTSIFRRQYLKQEVTTHHQLHQKLHYYRPNKDGSKGSIKGENVLIGKAEAALNSLGSPYPQTGLRHYGGKQIYKPGHGIPANTKFERGVWYYVEEEYKAATFNNITGEYNSDGAYRLWFAKSGDAPKKADPPMLEVTGLQLPGLSGPGGGTQISLWGNFQHWIHNLGHWYMDDILISDKRVGPISNPVANSINSAPPMPPLPK